MKKRIKIILILLTISITLSFMSDTYSRYVEDTSIYSVVHQLAVGRVYKDLLFLTDSAELTIDFIEKHPPIKVI